MQVERIERVEGRGIPMRGNDIDTDRIVPARFLRAITFEGMEQHLFEDERAGSAAARASGVVHPFDIPQYQGASVLIVNSNFGCGSSREHAPQAIKRWGIQAIVGESFSEIFFGNASIIGLPCVTATAPDIEALMRRIESAPATQVVVDLPARSVRAGEAVYPVGMPVQTLEAMVTGAWDSAGLLRERFDEVQATADRLPYVTGFASLPPR